MKDSGVVANLELGSGEWGHRRRLHGAMGAIAPTAKKLWGRCVQVAPTEIVLCRRCTQPKGAVKLRMCHYESKKGALI